MKVNIIPRIVNKLRRCIAIVEDGDTCTQSGGIAQGKYVVWKGVLCRAGSAISYEGSLSSLTAIDGGIGNQMQTQIDTLSTNMGTVPSGKTLQGEIEDVSSKIDGIEIPANTDLNTLTTPGNYYSPNSSRTPTLSNAPFATSAFTLQVKKRGNYLDQIAQANGVVKVRGNSSGGFSDWEELALNSNLGRYTLAGGTSRIIGDISLNTIDYNGRLYCNQFCTDLPVSGIPGYLDSYIYYKSPLFAKQVFTPYNSCNTYIRICDSGTWSNWMKYAFATE